MHFVPASAGCSVEAGAAGEPRASLAEGWCFSSLQGQTPVEKHRDGCYKEQIICNLNCFGLQTTEMSYLWLREINNVLLSV